MKIYNLFEGSFLSSKLIMSTTDKSKLIPDVLRLKNDQERDVDIYMELEIWEDGEEIEDSLICNDIIKYLEIK